MKHQLAHIQIKIIIVNRKCSFEEKNQIKFPLFLRENKGSKLSRPYKKIALGQRMTSCFLTSVGLLPVFGRVLLKEFLDSAGQVVIMPGLLFDYVSKTKPKNVVTPT